MSKITSERSKFWIWIKRFLVLTAIFSFSVPLLAQTQPIFGFPDSYGIGPRAMGMGDAFVAVADDASAAYWNVAGLAQMTGYTLSLSSAPVYFQSKVDGQSGFGFPWYASMQFIMPIAKDNTFGISFFRPFHPQINLYADTTTGAGLSSTQLAEASYLQNPSFQESVIQLSYAAKFEALKNFSVGINIKRVTNDPYYIRNFFSDTTLSSFPIHVVGYGLDLGLLYRIPITKYSEEVRLGVALNNLVSRVQYTDGMQLTSSNVNFNVGSGFETPIPPEVILGLAYKNDFFFKLRNITDIDFDQISDTRFGGSPAYTNSYLRFGTEFWFFKDSLGVRAGYNTPLSYPGVITLGLSIRALGGDFQTDLAYLQPISPSASIASGSQIATYDSGGINFEPFEIGASFQFGGGQEIPPPKVNAFVTPESFNPSQGEKATFYLDTTEDVTIRHWSVLIYDAQNQLVRSFRAEGDAPTKLLWGGESDQYEPLSPGIYTWSFQVQDELDHIGSTPIQTVEILKPEAQVPVDPSKLLAMRQQQAVLLQNERRQLTNLAQRYLKQMLTEPEGNTLSVVGSATPVDQMGNSLTAEENQMSMLGFNNIDPELQLNAHFDTDALGEPIVEVSYRSKLDNTIYLCEEAAEVIKTAVNSVGTDKKQIMVKVYYDKNDMTLTTPSLAAANYAMGEISLQQLIQLSDVRINGEKVMPNVD